MHYHDFDFSSKASTEYCYVSRNALMGGRVYSVEVLLFSAWWYRKSVFQDQMLVFLVSSPDWH